MNNVAREEIESAISVIRAFTRVFYHHSEMSAFGLPYEINRGMTGFVAESGGSFSIQMDGHGFFSEFDLNNTVLKRLKEELFFNDFERIVGKKWDDLNSLERAIRVTLLWLGRSVIALTTSEAFTQCAIALERILFVDDEQSSVDKFADRLSYLIAVEPDHRKYVHKVSKRLYDIRSKIVHAGFESVEIHQLAEFEGMAINALVSAAALLENLDDHKALKDLLHDRKME